MPGKDDCWRFVLPLFAESLGESLTVGVEEFLAALLPGRFHFRGSDVPVGTAFPEHCSEVLPESKEADRMMADFFDRNLGR